MDDEEDDAGARTGVAELTAEVAEARADTGFMAALARVVERDRALLDRLADR